MSYSLEQLKQKLGMSGWRAHLDDSHQEGTLKELAEAAHARHAEGKPPGHLQEVETEIKVEMMQLQELWRHMGLPVI
ncbi:MAG TPA: hypothetical protein VJ798_01090 [Rhizomicrobium sp.]|nr:hypothetical protein [Rhizomicrobium sp.]